MSKVTSTITSRKDRDNQQTGLPRYTRPVSGILSYLPASWVPFGELARIDRPTGIYLFYLPHLFGTLYATSAGSHVSLSLSDIVYKNAILFAGTVSFRAAACSWNDSLDYEYDRQVLRCRLRPVARGAVTLSQAHIFTVFLTSLALAFLYLLPRSCWAVSLPSIFLLALYPFAKRFTDFPQTILGIQVGIGFFLGAAAIDDGCFKDISSFAALRSNRNIQAMIAFYLANACWTVVYDTVYAQQDVEDDLKAGVRSIAVKFRGRTRALLWGVSSIVVAMLLASGSLQNFGYGYITVTCGGTMTSLSYMLSTIDFTAPTECAWWFRNGTWFVGSSISGGLILEILRVR
ncbi:UbiA prenyltransferase family-domain-containing protein [Nemania diffusa]|nr:UbiA prenyltransferase family-domain-containing protein [Nemania diffusa]